MTARRPAPKRAAPKTVAAQARRRAQQAAVQRKAAATHRLASPARSLARIDAQWQPVPVPAPVSNGAAPQVSPVVLAVMAAMPVAVHSQSKAPVLPPVAANALPQQAATWQAAGTTGSTWTVTGNNAVLNQQAQRGVYNWQSYNIGANASVTYQFNQAGSAALNRVTGGDPSQILGSLRSTVPGADGQAVTGGTVLLINPNGVLFGNGARVETGSLIASTLNVKDSDFLSGFNSIASAEPTFAHEGGAELFVDAKSFVRVEQGAEIKTASGGQVFLFAKNVENAGSISTPGGQTVMAAGERVYLQDPGAEKLYASEVNDKIPALRGFLVEVGGAAGRVLNTGSIDVGHGNATLVGLSVNQMGRITATTSVTENGSVFLLARGGATGTGDAIDGYKKQATTGGELVLGEGSRIEITPDTTPGSDGKVATIDGNSAFTQSRIELAGQTVVFEKDASIKAPAAIVNVRAEVKPNYESDYKTAATLERSDQARIVMGEGATIDVSGTTSTVVSAARNFVTTEILGGADLADASSQRDGLLYRQKVTYDVRTGTPILSASSQQGYANTIRRDAAELMSTGGQVNLTSSGAVVTHKDSVIDVSGGQVTYTDAQVNPTVLVAADGTRYTLNTAPKDLQYVAIEGVKTTAADPYGLQTGFRPQNNRTEAGYVDGQDAGRVSVLTQQAVLDGQLKGGVQTGSRQASGVDTAAARAVLELGRRQIGSDSSDQGNLFGKSTFGDGAQLTAMTISGQTPAVDSTFWSDARNAVVPAGRISAATINQSGFGTVRITSRESITIDKGADLRLPDLGVLEVRASGEGGITLGGNITAHGGTVLAQTANTVAGQQGGDVVLGEDSTIDVSGTFVNRYIDGAQQAAALAGGTVKLLSAHTLDLESHTTIDVSGGATVSTSGNVSGTAAGGISLESNRATQTSSDTVGDLRLSGTTLRGWSLTKGGSLRIRSAGVEIVADDGGPALLEGPEPGQLRLTSAFFSQGGFGSYDIEGGAYLRIGGTPSVVDDTRDDVPTAFTLAPRQLNWGADAAARQAATGSSMASVFKQVALLPDAQRRATNLTLSASGLVLDQAQPDGVLTLAPDVHIDADAGAAVKLTANRVLDVQGDITAHGGSVTMALQGNGSRDSRAGFNGYAGTFDVGSGALIDVSGTALRDVTTNGQQTGRVLDGGAITLSVTDAQDGGRQTRIDVARGAELRADGAHDTLDVSVLTNTGTRVQREAVDSAGGRITVNANDGGATLAGTLSARSGGGTAAGGSLTIAQPDKLKDAGAGRVVEEHRIELSASAPTASDERGVVQIGADAINAGGFADVALSSTQRIHVRDDVALSTARSISLTAETLTADAGASLSLIAPTAVTLSGPVQASGTPYTASGGDGVLAVQTGQLRLAGTVTLQGIGEVQAKATDSVRIDAINRVDTDAAGVTSLPTGGLYTQANITLDAPQTAVSTLVAYTLSAPGQKVTFTGGNTASTAPIAAGGQLTVEAANIVQDGVLRAPLGRISLNATESLTLTSRSLTSVSGDGLTVPVGTTADGTDWSYAGVAQSALPEKAVQLLAPGQSVTVASGAVIDASGGGKAQAVEFVPGPGGSADAFVGPTGSFAIVPTSGAYAANDLHIARLTDASNLAAGAVPAGQTITFGAGAVVPAGTYAVLPARYALLSGAFLVTPSGSARVAMGTVQARGDGTQLVAGQLGSTGTAYATAATGFIVRTSTQAKQLSEMTLTDVDSLVAQAAQATGAAVPRLAQDAGNLDIAAAQLVLQGQVLLKKAQDSIDEIDARGGGLAIAADRIRVGNQPVAEAGVLALDAAMLNTVGADSLTLGALRQGTTAAGRQLAVMAREVVVDTPTQALQAGDVVLAATDRVAVATGAQVQATGTASAETLAVQGDGALLRVSADAAATSVRTDVARTQGTLDVGAGARLQGGAITAEATAVNTIASSADLQARALTVGAARVAVGDEATLAAAGLGADTLAVTGTLAQRLAGAERTTLRSFDSIDFHGAATLGSDGLGQLTLDAPVLRTLGSSADVRAGSLLLTNTSGGTADAAAGSGVLHLTATTGDATIGPGTMAVQGAAQTQVQAARSIVLDGGAGKAPTSLSVGGDLLLQANSLTATQRTEAQLSAGGRLVVAGNTPTSSTDDSPRADAGSGASVVLSAQQIEQGGRIDLSSGSLTLRATGEQTVGQNQAAIEFLEGSVTHLAGKAYTFDGQTVATAGGSLTATAAQGNVVLADGSRIDVSAGGKGARAGDVTLSATQGSAVIDGTLLATSDASQPNGGRLTLDTREAFNLAQLAEELTRDVPAGQANFAERVSVRNRAGDQVLEAGTVLRSQRIELEADAGSLTVAGTLDASGAQGGRVVLSAGQNLIVADGAKLLAHATADGRDGGRVALASTSGTVALQQGATVDTHGQAGGQDGQITLRALRDGNDVKVAPIAATLAGVGAVTVEGYRVYTTTNITATQLQTYHADVASWLGTDGSHATAMRDRLAAGDAALADKLGVRAGIEVRSTSSLALNTAWNLSGAGVTGATERVAGQPINVTLRSAGNLTVAASLSDGFSTTAPTGLIQGTGGDIRLVAGADMGAAQVDRTIASETKGDVVIGKSGADVLVRTTTGDIDIAAGRDVTLLNQRAAVYTTGLPVAAADLPGYVAPASANAAVSTTQPLLLARGGSVDVTAGRDVNGATDATQTGVDWQWRGFNGGALSWWSRYDKFKQGFGALGGGDVSVQAGRDAVRVQLAAAENAYVPVAAVGQAAVEHVVSNGSASLMAGRDVLGGFVMAGGESLTVRAGRDVTADAADNLLKVRHDNTVVDLSANGQLMVGSVSTTLLNAPVTQWNQANRELAYGQRIAGTAPDASLRMVSDAGDVQLAGVDGDAASAVVPSQLVIAAPRGAVSVGTAGSVIVAPAARASVLLASQGDLTVGELVVKGAVPEQASPQLIGSKGDVLGTSPVLASARPQVGVAEPVRLISEDGSVALGTVAVAAPLRVIAAGDITASSVDVMHTQATDLSLAQAGGNITVQGFGNGWTVHGPGDQVVLAGGDVKLGQSDGFVAMGNRQVQSLPASSANLTVLAGVAPKIGDYVQARNRYFQLLGGAGIDSYAGDLAVQLKALANNQPLPTPGSVAARDFTALRPDEQLAEAKALAGDAAYQSAVLAWMRARTHDATLDMAGALTKLAALDGTAKAELAGRVLGDAWLARTSPEQQLAAVLAMADSRGGAYAGDLAAFVTARTGTRPVDTADALTRFAALPLEQQLLHMNRVLAGELKAAGRTASALSGAERDAAYAKGYEALATVFPNVGKAKATVDMGSSQIKTQQGSEITVLAPRGGANVGRVTADSLGKAASELGVVTTAGGGVFMAVRDDVAVNRSRVFTVADGDVLMWSSEGSIDAGKGAKTVTGAPPPVYRLVNGQIVVDTSGSFSGSGIAVLSAGSDLDLYAPKGEINAGDAGIKSAGNAFFGAVRFVGADNLQVGGTVSGGPAPVAPASPGSLALAPAATSAGQRMSSNEDDDEERRKRAKRRNLLLDFLGFGENERT